MRRAVSILPLLLVAGCATSGGVVQSFWSSIFGRKAAAVQKAEAKQGTLEDKAVTAAQVEVIKTGVALAAADDSLPVEVARRTNANAAALLNQREALSVAVQDDAVATAKGLLARAEAAERSQQATEATNRTMSAQLASVRAELKKLATERDEEARKNLTLANELRSATVVKWAGVAGSTLLGLLAIAYRLNIGRLQTAAGEVLAHVQEKHGKDAADAARSVAGVVLHTGEQKGVYKVFSTLTGK